MASVISVEHHVRPSYSAFVVETRGGMKQLFLNGDALVSSDALPREVASNLKQSLRQGVHAAAQRDAGAVTMTGGAARTRKYVKAAAFKRSVPRSVLQIVQQLPDPEALIDAENVHVRVDRPGALGSSRQRASQYGYRSAQSPECRALFQKRGGKLVAPTPKHNQCNLSPFDFLNFVDFVTRHRNYPVHQYVQDRKDGYPPSPYDKQQEAQMVSGYSGATMCEKILNVLPLPPQLANKIRRERWSVVRHLGQGEYGTTFLAVNAHGKQAAVKVMVETGHEKISPAEEFDLHRIFAAMGLAPRAYYATTLTYQGTKLHIFVMERVEFTLYDLLCYQRLSPSMLESIGYALAKFMWTMYKKGVTHGDMHTQNIMFRYNAKSKRYEPVLIDFGFATTKFNDPDVDALQLISDLNQLTMMSPSVVNYFVRVLSKVVSKIRGHEVKIGKRRSQWEEYVDQYIARREHAVQFE